MRGDRHGADAGRLHHQLLDIAPAAIRSCQRGARKQLLQGGILPARRGQLSSSRALQDAQAKIRSGYVEDFYPYPAEQRFCNAFAGDAAAGS